MSSLNKELFGSDDEDDDDEVFGAQSPFSEPDDLPPDDATGRTSHDFHPDLYTPSFDPSNLDLFPSIPGLVLLRSALTHAQQSAIVRAVIDGGYFATPEQNQTMHFGKLPPHVDWLGGWTVEVQRKLKEEGREGLFPRAIVERTPLFDQAIVNLYTRGEGIKSHVDLARFADGILILSLLTSCVMTMRPASEASKVATTYNTNTLTTSTVSIPVLLRPGDVLSLSGPARYDWEHGIEERMFDVLPDGERIQRGTRISVTLRRMMGDGVVISGEVEGEEERGKERESWVTAGRRK
ncbi:hypothetical protein BC938DRAFT_476459 [Jimgerdemannia flammicorona]|uniref:Fe2OG dioxygenase domain-containing protein n=1 Tax=Jimgerdemannia flammicorona TaxID=994334 RepID=A0A433QZ39_9FUNG|nr:hypothetical protein BC938DRAFT_476459 [Jimgerdemannia flammicorona]